MNPIVSRSNASSIIAACIIAGGLIAAALIDTHRTPLASASPVAPGTVAPARPPITEESATTQLRAQILAANVLHTYVQGHTTYTLQDVKVTHVIYDPKEDSFTLTYDYVWQPAMPLAGPQSDIISLSNNGYGHYYGTAVLNYTEDNASMSSQPADITIK